MLFSSMIFLWAFLPIVLISYYLVKEEYRNYVLIVASIIFYAWGEPLYIFLMLFSIGCNYLFGILLSREEKIGRRKIILGLCIVINIGLLWYFKYSTNCMRFLGTIAQLDVQNIKEITLPIGISFYTFQAMSYVIDLYRGEIKVQKNFWDLALYISFFPQLVAGPIVKYKDINEQLKSRTVDIDGFAYGVKRFIYGLGKKVIISNTVAEITDQIFAVDISELNTGIVWFGVLMYTLQIYFDFSGYSDMAIGLGRMFGFHFLENFNYPYISQSIKEFWRRWHMSLSGWFRDYVYIPLGGNRKGKIRTYINLFIVFLLTGIWHGASLNFLCWGLWHGFFIIVERLGFGKVLDKNPLKIFNHIYTIFVVVIGWAMFRCKSFAEAMTVLKAMFKINMIGNYHLSEFITNRAWIIICAAVLLCGIIQSIIPGLQKLIYSEESTAVVEYAWLIAIMLLSIIYLVSGTYNPFIYFQF